MKFYNPFKWHIVKFREKYAVRRLSLFWLGFVFMDVEDGIEWSTHRNAHLKYCFTNYLKAKEMMEDVYKFVEQ